MEVTCKVHYYVLFTCIHLGEYNAIHVTYSHRALLIDAFKEAQSEWSNTTQESQWVVNSKYITILTTGSTYM